MAAFHHVHIQKRRLINGWLAIYVASDYHALTRNGVRSMTEKKKPWQKPEIKEIKAGSAEGKGGQIADGQGSSKS